MQSLVTGQIICSQPYWWPSSWFAPVWWFLSCSELGTVCRSLLVSWKMEDKGKYPVSWLQSLRYTVSLHCCQGTLLNPLKHLSLPELHHFPRDQRKECPSVKGQPSSSPDIIIFYSFRRRVQQLPFPFIGHSPQPPQHFNYHSLSKNIPDVAKQHNSHGWQTGASISDLCHPPLPSGARTHTVRWKS